MELVNLIGLTANWRISSAEKINENRKGQMYRERQNVRMRKQTLNKLELKKYWTFFRVKIQYIRCHWRLNTIIFLWHLRFTVNDFSCQNNAFGIIKSCLKKQIKHYLCVAHHAQYFDINSAGEFNHNIY